ncbi:MAG: 2-oxoacid:acceptor oxidoreductase subunit alpha [Bacteroidales bacterium]|nr:2-oxoacid:acceptor oxidoreductase subunit alpha [Bacteroidales bacterium]MDD2570910.1 2-oxoacid:acceptor oxidoreductase subunit alpha [Bacteroidales bacterium]MDD3870573.1 2-oxoacid:acceptor oxidoreductase subunit alpha [Bacteroidales bacterium]MDD4812604.1 2-oxoacid:acceptor oxidoreductase subunit alpha [Bacteroidales bacterium]
MSKEAKVIEIEEVAIRFSGDSGDGMQLTGTLFSDTSALFGNDVSTFPDYPAEIRAPQGTVGGVSGFQVHFGHTRINTPGDYCDVLVVMNPAALKANFRWIKPDGILIYDSDSFDAKGIEKAGYKSDPFKEEQLEGIQVISAPISSLTRETLKDIGLDQKSILRCKNMFALGMVSWLYDRPLDHAISFFNKKFASKPILIEANTKVLHSGYYYAETIEAFTSNYRIKPAEIEKGKYRTINGNTAAAWGMLAAAQKAGLQLFLGSYPITPATGILEELAARKDLGVKTFQAEDEIAGVCTAIGASFAGSLAVTSTSGPGLALKGEAIGLAVMTELPLVIIDVQRGGPSTGLPTKTEQSDLMQALYGRNGESPIVVLASSTPSNCFDFAYMASKIAVEHMTPVILLSDGFLANGSEPWRIPDLNQFPEIKVPKPNTDAKDWMPYLRDEKTQVRTWAVPGMPGFEHRVGGLEKMNRTGSVSYVPENHELMTHIREEKVQNVARDIPNQEIIGDEDAELLIIGWGGTFGHLVSALTEIRREGHKVALAHFNYINPLPANTGELLSKFKKHLVCEINLGQFVNHLRMKFPEYQYRQFNKIMGLPFTVNDLKAAILKNLED